jgi:hypothetical protein
VTDHTEKAENTRALFEIAGVQPLTASCLQLLRSSWHARPMAVLAMLQLIKTPVVFTSTTEKAQAV